MSNLAADDGTGKLEGLVEVLCAGPATVGKENDVARGMAEEVEARVREAYASGGMLAGRQRMLVEVEVRIGQGGLDVAE